MIHILLVEDDTDLNQVVCRHLEMHGYHAVGCKSPIEAYDVLYARNFDLIISDIMMPGIDGFEFAKTIREENTNIPILFITAREDFSAKEQGYKIGIDDYMVKPINLDELLLHISALLRRAHIASEKKLSLGSLEIDEIVVYDQLHCLCRYSAGSTCRASGRSRSHPRINGELGTAPLGNASCLWNSCTDCIECSFIWSDCQHKRNLFRNYFCHPLPASHCRRDQNY